MYKCVCGAEFEKKQSFGAHCGRCIINLGEDEYYRRFPGKLKTYVDKSILYEDIEFSISDFFNDWISRKRKCKNCNRIMNEFYGSGIFCSYECAYNYSILEIGIIDNKEILTCKCGRSYTNRQSYIAHCNHCLNNLGLDKFIILKKSDKKKGELVGKKLIQHNKEIRDKLNIKYNTEICKWISEEHKCERCGKLMTEKYASGRFCSERCARSYSRSKNSIYNSEIQINNSVESRRERSKVERLKWTIDCINNVINPYSGGYSKFRNALVEFGFKEYKCDICGISEWNGKSLSLQVHHINGHDDNSLKSIQFLCPNCHSQTDGFAWGTANKNRNRMND